MQASSSAAQGLVTEGLSLHQRGQVEQAAARYRQALQIAPEDVNALYLLGVVHVQLGLPGEAEALLARAIAQSPGLFAAHAMRGNALLQLGRAEQAIASFEQALAINPGIPATHTEYGTALMAAGRYPAAVDALTRALALDPNQADAHTKRGISLHQLGRLDDAVADLDAAVRLDPRSFEAHANRARALGALGRLDEALESYDRACALSPGSAALHANRSVPLRDLGRLQEAEAACRTAIALAPGHPEAHYNLGGVLDDAGRWQEAADAYSQAVALRPAFPEALYSKAVVLHRQQRVEEALQHYDQALALDPAHHEARWNRSLALLLSGDFARGWPEYESRWSLMGPSASASDRGVAAPLWTGEQPLDGKAILLHAEQGLGDTIQFCRYAAAVKARGAGRVVLEVQPELTRLLRDLDGVDEVIAPDAPRPVVDVHCPLMSLPRAFATTLDTIPSSVPYIRAQPDKAAAWRQRLGEHRRPRIGLVWSGALHKGSGLAQVHARRNIPLAMLAPLADADVDLFSLQKGDAAQAELDELVRNGWSGPRLQDLAAELNDFSDTAALTQNLDLVLSVDTAVAHLAGALGKPVWILNRHDTCWRWLQDRTDSPWYPSARLFRQPSPGDWHSVVQALRQSLDALVQTWRKA